MLIIWLICLLLLTAVAFFSGYRFGPNAALLITSLVCLLFPFWICVKPYDVEIHLNVAVGVAALGYYLIHPKSVFRTRLVVLDYVMIAIVLVHGLSDIRYSGLAPFIAVQIYGEWFVAYVLGRLALSSFTNIRNHQALGAAIGAILSILAITECLSSVDVFEFIFGSSELGSAGTAYRWGFKRAAGPTNHPLYFGTLLFLFSPWLIQYSIFKWQESRGKFWLAGITPAVAGIFATLSRGPVLAIAVLALGCTFIFIKRLRIPIFASSLLVSILLISGAFNIVGIVEALGGEKPNISKDSMVIDGTKVAGSSASARVYLLNYYSAAVRRAGLFGYGSEATSKFPPDVPSGGNMDIKAMHGLKWIDNQYLLFTLRFGYLGVLCWTGALLCTAWNFYYLTSKCPIDLKWFCACNASVIVGVMFIQWTVWMPQDYGFYLIWLMGGSAGLMAEYKAKHQRRKAISQAE